MNIWSWGRSLAERVGLGGSSGETADAPLQELPAQLADILETGLIHYGADGVRCYANNAARTFFGGFESGSGEFQTIELFTGFARREGQDFFSGYADDESVFSCFMMLQGRRFRVRAVRMNDNGTAVTLNDITDVSVTQAGMERAITEKKEMELVLESLDGGVAVCCVREGKNYIQFANQSFRALSKISEDDLSGVDIAGVLQEAVGADAISLREAVTAGKAFGAEWRVENKRGAPCWYKVSLVPLRISGKGEGCFVCFLNDVTEVHVQKAQLFQSQKLEALGQLAGGVAHDFNNLLSIVDGYARMALKHVDEENPAFNYLERIKQANRRGASLTKQLLTFGRHKIISESVVDIGTLLIEQEILLRPLLNASINLSISADDSLFVECAADGIAQILMNLVINARDAMPDGGAIFIDAATVGWEDLPLSLPLDRRRDKFVRLCVEDSGTGMSHETQARIFDPFFTTKDQGKGSGLGLSMVYGLVRQFGGVIDVRSAPCAGTAMSIYFPLSDKKPERKAVVRSENGNGSVRFEGYTALVAEDEPDLLFVIGNMLEDMGMKVIKAKDGNEALVRQDEYDGTIDFLLTDVVMPDLNGVRLAEMMAELRPEMKVVFMSGYPANGTMARVQLPAKAVLLAKPVEFEKLSGILAARLQNDPDAAEDKVRGLYRWRSAGSV